MLEDVERHLRMLEDIERSERRQIIFKDVEWYWKTCVDVEECVWTFVIVIPNIIVPPKIINDFLIYHSIYMKIVLHVIQKDRSQINVMLKIKVIIIIEYDIYIKIRDIYRIKLKL